MPRPRSARLRPAALVLAALALLLVAPSPAAAAPLAELRTTYFFAEGSTNPPFDTWLLVFNPQSTPASASVTFMSDGVATVRSFTVQPRSRFSLFVNQVLPNANFGMRVDSNVPIAAERAMYFRQDGTVVKGISAPSTTWLFGEGATAFPHETWFLLLNPGATPANVTLNFLLEGGAPPRRTQLTIAPFSRASIFANLILPPAAFSTTVASDQPIVAERAMYLAGRGGHASEGATAPASAWFFAEGSTNPPFDTWFLIMNPNANPVQILGRFFLDRGGPGTLLGFTVPANSRFSLFADQIQPNANFGATIVSEGGPVVIERSMFFGNGSHNTLGATSLDVSWLFAEGSTAFPFQEWLLLTNPSAEDNATATLTFFFPDGSTTSRTVVVGGEGRTSVFTDLFLPQTAVSVRVDSNRPIVAERSMFFGNGNGGHNTVGFSLATGR